MLNFLKKYFNLSLTFFFITGLVFGSISGYFWANTRTRSLALSKLQLKSPNLKYTNPLLAFELGGKDQFDEFRQIDKAVDKIIAEAKNQGATNIGVYFRDLTTGHWTGINETSQFTPGSLQKVPLMIAYLKIAESNNGILSQQISDTYPTDANAMEIIKPKEFIEKNKKYSVEDMIRHMIIYSDNNATAALTDYIGIESVSKIFNDLSLKFNPDQTLTDYISPKEYGLFLRVLHNSTYLNPEMSDRALGILVQSDFKEGLAAGLPEKIPVAHKHGELHGFYPNQLKKEVSQLHDCGIIYYPGHPYLLCVMTKGGPDLTPLKSAIRAISQLFYDLMKNVYP